MTQLLPVVKARFFDADGNPLSGGKVRTYEAGTTTDKETYTDSTATIPNANPVILDSQGYANIWLGDGDYKIALLTSTDVPVFTVDNVRGDTAQGFAAKVYPISSSTNIIESYDQSVLVCTNTINLSLLPAATAGEGFVIPVYNSGTGKVTIDPDGSETINGAATLILKQKQSAMIVCDGTSWFALFLGSQTADTIASAGTTDIANSNGNYVTITGTTTIIALGTADAGAMRFVKFSGALTLTHNATSLILPGGVNITTAAGDTAVFISEGSGNWRAISYQKATGLPISGRTILQRVSVFTGAMATGSTTIPADNTIPQITEGDEYMSLPITPKSATSELVIEVIAHFANNTSVYGAMALFQDAIVNALKVAVVGNAANQSVPVVLKHIMTSGTTSVTTFKVRAGGSGGTMTFNGQAGTAYYGGAIGSGIIITEYAT